MRTLPNQPCRELRAEPDAGHRLDGARHVVAQRRIPGVGLRERGIGKGVFDVQRPSVGQPIVGGQFQSLALALAARLGTDTRIAQLNEFVRQAAINFINQVEAELGITLRISWGYRTFKEQDDLYAIGRTINKELPTVTDAKGGESYHNYGLAIDVVEIKNGEAIWNMDWEKISKIGIQNGFEWGGSWTVPIDRPHFQMTLGLSIEDLPNGKIPQPIK